MCETSRYRAVLERPSYVTRARHRTNREFLKRHSTLGGLPGRVLQPSDRCNGQLLEVERGWLSLARHYQLGRSVQPFNRSGLRPMCLSFHLIDNGLQVFFEVAASLDSLAVSELV